MSNEDKVLNRTENLMSINQHPIKSIVMITMKTKETPKPIIIFFHNAIK